MKEITLPITQTFSITIEPQDLDMANSVDIGNGQLGVPLGSVVNPDISNIMETARVNGGKVLYATTSIEQQLEKLLLLYFMGPFVGHSDSRHMFETEILQSSALSYGTKKELVSKVINASDLLPGKKKNKLQSYLKKIMEWRNAFAHGKVQHDSLKGCFVKYYSGSTKTLSLSNEFWGQVETSFSECSNLIEESTKKLSKIK